MKTKSKTIKRHRASAVEWPFNDARYQLLSEKATEFVAIREGDMAFQDPKVNLVALESMLLGWVYCQAWFQKYVEAVNLAHPRDNPYLTAADKCMEAASDATRKLTQYP